MWIFFCFMFKFFKLCSYKKVKRFFFICPILLTDECCFHHYVQVTPVEMQREINLPKWPGRVQHFAWLLVKSQLISWKSISPFWAYKVKSLNLKRVSKKFEHLHGFIVFDSQRWESKWHESFFAKIISWPTRNKFFPPRQLYFKIPQWNVFFTTMIRHFFPKISFMIFKCWAIPGKHLRRSCLVSFYLNFATFLCGWYCVGWHLWQ